MRPMALWCQDPRAVNWISLLYLQAKSVPAFAFAGGVPSVVSATCPTGPKLPSPSRLSNDVTSQIGWLSATAFQGSGWVVGSSKCATRVWTRIVVMSLLQFFRPSHQLMHPSTWKIQSNGVAASPPLVVVELMPLSV